MITVFVLKDWWWDPAIVILAPPTSIIASLAFRNRRHSPAEASKNWRDDHQNYAVGVSRHDRVFPPWVRV
jgi:hypothetical protein